MFVFSLALVTLIIAVHHLPGATAVSNVALDKNTAASFLHRRFKRWPWNTSLKEECYKEGCRFEEVKEVYSGEKAKEYWYDYRCSKFRKNCKVKCQHRTDCSFGEWGSWNNGHILHLGCYMRSRSKPFKHEIQVILQRDNCNGLNGRCRNPPTELQSFCICKKASCVLNEWSQWSGAVPPRGNCSNHIRTRSHTPSYSNVKLYNVPNCRVVTSSCPPTQESKRKQCSCPVFHCNPSRRSEWLPKQLDAGKCGQLQTRTVDYAKSITGYTESFGSCPKSDLNCPRAVTEKRTHCMCTYRDTCDVSAWSAWTNPLSGEGCKTQSRRKHYTSPIKHVLRPNCDGLLKYCPPEPEETRTKCKCPHLKCLEGDWSEWDRIPEDTCVSQSRRKQMTSSDELVERVNTCNGVQTSCPKPSEESRNWCNCSYREDCSLLQWEAWKGDIPDVGCGVQVRTRQYNNSVIYIDRKSCDGLESCPTLKDETRTKCNCNEVICKWSDWFQESSDPSTGCIVETRVQNISSGFRKLERDNTCEGMRTMCHKEPRVERHKYCERGNGGGSSTSTVEPVTQPTTVKPTTQPTPAKYVEIGCYRDTAVRPRLLPKLIANLRKFIDWYNMGKTVQACAEIAREQRMEYFSVQFYGECWSGVHAGTTYARDGENGAGCWRGVGGPKHNFVYKLTNKHECTEELHGYKLFTSQGKLGSHWCTDAADQWLKVDLLALHRITGIGTKGTSANSWVELYTVEFSEEGKIFIPYKHNKNTVKVFAGNADRYTVEMNWLDSPIEARQLILHPREWTSSKFCLTVHLFGCQL